jgi:RNA polymerase sigma-70 factor (ECF subfamily)
VFADADAGRARHSVRAGYYGKPEYYTPPRPRLVTEIFPELMYARRKEDNTPSCSLSEAMERQDLFVNQTVATFALQLLWQFIRESGLNIHGYFINLESGRVTPLPIKCIRPICPTRPIISTPGTPHFMKSKTKNKRKTLLLPKSPTPDDPAEPCSIQCVACEASRKTMSPARHRQPQNRPNREIPDEINSKELLPPFVRTIKMALMAGSNDESRLIEQCRSGDPEAYAALVTQHQKMIRAVTFRMTGSLDDAEELAQDACLRAYQQLASFDGGSKFSTWLCKIAINLSLDWRRRESRRDAIHSKWAADVATANDPGAGFPDELSRRVQAALNRLPAKQRAAIVLTVYENQSHAEAAKTLGCTEATISWRVFAARQKLKRLLKDLSHETA